MWERRRTRSEAVEQARAYYLDCLAGDITRADLALLIHKLADDCGAAFEEIRDAAVESIDPR